MKILGFDIETYNNQLLDDAQLQVKKIMTAPDGSPLEEDFHEELR